MDYNTDRTKLILPEYGRNVQRMVEYVKTVDDTKKETKWLISLLILWEI